jgi:hypothetical protein
MLVGSASWAGCGGQTGDDGLSDQGGSAANAGSGGSDGSEGGAAGQTSAAGAGGQGGMQHAGPTGGGGGQSAGGSTAGGAGGEAAGAAGSAAGTDQGGAAGTDPGDDPIFSMPTTCSSGAKWTKGNKGSSSMHPGGTCISCHASNFDAPKFIFAGTVYKTGHEPDDCNGVNGSTDASGAQVIVTDANGQVFTAAVNKVGNFLGYPVSGKTFKTPYTARVVFNGKERAMGEHQTSGDCNSCHTEAGTKDAPGRIALPE